MRETKRSWSGKKRSKQQVSSTRNALSKKKVTVSVSLISLIQNKGRKPTGRGRSKKSVDLTKKAHSVHYSMIHMTSMISLCTSLTGSSATQSHRPSSKPSKRWNNNYVSLQISRRLLTWTSKFKNRIREPR